MVERAPKREDGPSTRAKSPKPSAKNGKSSVTLRKERAVRSAQQLLRKSTAITTYDVYGASTEYEEDYFVVPEKGRVYGRCGGRALRSLMEQRICDHLSRLGVAHSHAPRRYEVRVESGRVGAYAPCIVIRGRGREGKTTILEPLAAWNAIHVDKVRAFRKLYYSEFYVIMVAPGEVFDRMSDDAHDEQVLPSEVASLIARLAE